METDWQQISLAEIQTESFYIYYVNYWCPWMIEDRQSRKSLRNKIDYVSFA